MKNVLPLFVMLLTFNLSNAQIKIEENPIIIGEFGFGSTKQQINISETTYIWTYQDVISQDTKSIYLMYTELDDLYIVLDYIYDSEPKEKVVIGSKYHRFTVQFVKVMGVKSIQVISIDKTSGVGGTTPYITQKQLKKLFNKKETK